MDKNDGRRDNASGKCGRALSTGKPCPFHPADDRRERYAAALWENSAVYDPYANGPWSTDLVDADYRAEFREMADAAVTVADAELDRANEAIRDLRATVARLKSEVAEGEVANARLRDDVGFERYKSSAWRVAGENRGEVIARVHEAQQELDRRADLFSAEAQECLSGDEYGEAADLLRAALEGETTS